MEFSKAPESPQEPQSKSKSKHTILKIIICIIVIFFLATYFASYIATFQYEKNTKQLFLSTNSSYTGQEVTIDQVVSDGNFFNTVVKRLKVYNPPDYVSSYAVSTSEILISSDSILEVQGQNAVVDYKIHSVVLKNVNINYDINLNNQVNLHTIIDNIRKTYSQQNKNITQTKFKLGKLTIERPTVNIYRNHNIIKTIEVPTINIPFDPQKNTTYLETLQTASLKTIAVIDSAILK